MHGELDNQRRDDDPLKQSVQATFEGCWQAATMVGLWRWPGVGELGSWCMVGSNGRPWPESRHHRFGPFPIPFPLSRSRCWSLELKVARAPYLEGKASQKTQQILGV
jgi:hypothetical protein